MSGFCPIELQLIAGKLYGICASKAPAHFEARYGNGKSWNWAPPLWFIKDQTKDKITAAFIPIAGLYKDELPSISMNQGGLGSNYYSVPKFGESKQIIRVEAEKHLKLELGGPTSPMFGRKLVCRVATRYPKSCEGISEPGHLYIIRPSKRKSSGVVLLWVPDCIRDIMTEEKSKAAVLPQIESDLDKSYESPTSDNESLSIKLFNGETLYVSNYHSEACFDYSFVWAGLQSAHETSPISTRIEKVNDWTPNPSARRVWDCMLPLYTLSLKPIINPTRKRQRNEDETDRSLQQLTTQESPIRLVPVAPRKIFPEK